MRSYKNAKSAVLDALLATTVSAGIYIAGALTVASMLDLDMPCISGSDCASLSRQPFSHVGGLPFSAYGLMLYGLLGTLFVAQSAEPRLMVRTRQIPWLLATAGALVSWSLIWWALRAGYVCPWCMASACSMSALCLFSFLRGRRPFTPARPWLYIGPMATSLTMLLFFRPVYHVPVDRPLLDQHVLSRLADQDISPPVSRGFGPPTARVKFVMFVDLACSGCRSGLATVIDYVKGHDNLFLQIRYLPSMHSDSAEFASLAEAAYAEGCYWSFLEELCRSPYTDAKDAHRLLGAISRKPIVDGSPTKEQDERLLADKTLAESLGVWQSPTVIVFSDGHRQTITALELKPFLNALVAVHRWRLRSVDSSGDGRRVLTARSPA